MAILFWTISVLDFARDAAALGRALRRRLHLVRRLAKVVSELAKVLLRD